MYKLPELRTTGELSLYTQHYSTIKHFLPQVDDVRKYYTEKEDCPFKFPELCFFYPANFWTTVTHAWGIINSLYPNQRIGNFSERIASLPSINFTTFFTFYELFIIGGFTSDICTTFYLKIWNTNKYYWPENDVIKEYSQKIRAFLYQNKGDNPELYWNFLVTNTQWLKHSSSGRINYESRYFLPINFRWIIR